MANQSIYSAFERFWLHVISRINNKAEVNYVDEQIITVQNKIGEVPEGKTVIDLIGESGTSDDKEIFIAEYGVTTFAEIEEAYNAGKTVIILREVETTINVAVLTRIEAGEAAYFTQLMDDSVVKYSVNAVGNWSMSSYTLLKKTGGTMLGALVAQNNTNYTTKQVRNIILVAEGEDIPTGANGDVCLVYAP